MTLNEMALAMMQKGMRSKSMQKIINSNLNPQWGLRYIPNTRWDNNMLVFGINAECLQASSNQ
jgi:hypothetical protein